MSNKFAFREWRGKVLSHWLDYNSHMTEHRYLEAFGESSDAFYKHIGVDFDNSANGAFFTLETHLRHIAECHEGTPLVSDSQIIGYDSKRIHIFHRLFDGGGKLLATGEHLSIHVKDGKVCDMRSQMADRVAIVYERSIDLPLPDRIGSVVKGQLAHSRLSENSQK